MLQPLLINIPPFIRGPRVILLKHEILKIIQQKFLCLKHLFKEIIFKIYINILQFLQLTKLMEMLHLFLSTFIKVPNKKLGLSLDGMSSNSDTYNMHAINNLLITVIIN